MLRSSYALQKLSVSQNTDTCSSIEIAAFLLLWVCGYSYYNRFGRLFLSFGFFRTHVILLFKTSKYAKNSCDLKLFDILQILEKFLKITT